MAVGVNQRGATAGHDVVAGNKTVNNYAASAGHIEVLLQKLKTQIDQDDHARETIEELTRYHTRKSVDGIDGLEAKLNAAGLSHIFLRAIEQKEEFVKLLERYSLYSSAQQIFAHFLSKAENRFNYMIHPEVVNKSESEINCMVIQHIVDPIIEECGSEVFSLTYDHVFGMVYWLAEQCFVRWHK
jgi:hypothetical protein